MLELRGISKSFGSKTILNSINLTVMDGKTHVLLGSSGSGKSTLIRVIIGLLRLDAGTVKIDGEEQTIVPETTWARKIGYVPQDGGLFPHLTAKENVTLVARLSLWKAEQIASRLKTLSQSVMLDPLLLERFPHELSGGQSQRVSLMRAAFLDPKILILDEPLGALDPIIRTEVQTELREIFRKLGKTVLLITHDLSEARYFGDELSLLNEGRILQSGTFADLLERPADPFVTRFLNAQAGRLER